MGLFFCVGCLTRQGLWTLCVCVRVWVSVCVNVQVCIQWLMHGISNSFYTVVDSLFFSCICFQSLVNRTLAHRPLFMEAASMRENIQLLDQQEAGLATVRWVDLFSRCLLFSHSLVCLFIIYLWSLLLECEWKKVSRHLSGSSLPAENCFRCNSAVPGQLFSFNMLFACWKLFSV